MPGLNEEARIVHALRGAGCVFAEEEAALIVAHAPSGLRDAWVAWRVTGEPLEQILGWVDFCGLRIAVAKDVFVPRQRTRALVREAVRLANRRWGAVTRPVRVLDLCCGSGAVGIAVAQQWNAQRFGPGDTGAFGAASHGGAELFACDIHPAAVACARANFAAFGYQAADVYAGDFATAIPDRHLGAIDLIVANAPYVPTGEIAHMPPEARDHEPQVTLDGGVDGLDLHRRIAAIAPQWLAPGGSVLIETSRGQAPATADLLAALGSPRIVFDDGTDATIVAVSAISFVN